MKEINYPQLIEKAYLDLVRACFSEVSHLSHFGKKNYFYISFLTNYPGIVLADRLKDRYPTEMTIVLQHEFYNLKVLNDSILVDLSFDNILEHIEIPFLSLTAFTDPYAQIHLEFHPILPKVEKFKKDNSSENLIYFGK